MTRQKHLKQRIRERQAKTGESFTTARVHVLAQLKACEVPPRAPGGVEVVPSLASQRHAGPPVEQQVTVNTALHSWAARHRQDRAALQQMEEIAIQNAGRTIDLDKLAACAKAVLITEMIDGTPRRDRPYTKLPGDAMRLETVGDELEIVPSDTTPMSWTLVKEALEVASAFSGGAEWQIQPIWPIGRLTGATAKARKAAVRFLRIAGARVLVSVRPTCEDEQAEPGRATVPATASVVGRAQSKADGELAALNAHLGGSQACELIERADDLQGGTADGLYAEAERLLAAALQNDASNCTMLCSMGKLRLSQARGAAEQMVPQLLDDALLWFERASTIKADFFMAKVGHGDVHLEMSRRDPSQREVHLIAAIRGYKSALLMRNDLYLARVGLGNAYLEEARHRGGRGAKALLMDSAREFAAALALKPSLYRAQVGLGDVLVEQSKTLPPATAQTALASAWNHYQQALQLRPSLYAALCGCGDVELERARRGEPPGTSVSRASAIAMYERALTIHPTSYRAANGRRAAMDASP